MASRKERRSTAISAAPATTRCFASISLAMWSSPCCARATCIVPMLTRPVGRPSHAPLVWYAGFLYQAQSWDRARRVVAKVEWHHGELYPSVGFIVTNLTRPAKRVVRFYNQRGTAEQWIKEGKNALN